MKKFFLSVSALALMLPFAAKASDVSMSQVVLQGLDKVTGRLSTMTVNVGEKTQFGALDVYARVCYAHPPEEVPENASFLEIVERKPAGEAKVFSGWMFSSSPALSAMEHPVYDVWVLSCRGEQFKAPIPEPLVLEHPVPVVAPVSKLKEKSAADSSAEKQDESEVDAPAATAAPSAEKQDESEVDAPSATAAPSAEEQEQSEVDAPSATAAPSAAEQEQSEVDAPAAPAPADEEQGEIEIDMTADSFAEEQDEIEIDAAPAAPAEDVDETAIADD